MPVVIPVVILFHYWHHHRYHNRINPMLKKSHRISSSRLISLLFKKGKVYKNKPFTIRLLPSLHQVNQFAIIVSKKVAPKAVDRNRIKRQVSEVLRLNLNQLKAPIVASVMVKNSQLPYTYTKLEKGIKEFLNWQEGRRN